MSELLENRIESYLTGQMSASERRGFEADMKRDAELRLEVLRSQRVEQAIQSLGREQLSTKMNNIRKTHGPLREPSSTVSESWKVWNRPNGWKILLAVAVGLMSLTILLSGLLSTSNKTPQFAYLPAPSTLGVEVDQKAGYQLYAEGQFDEAIISLKEVKSGKAQLYLGFAYLQLDTPRIAEAEAAFDEVMRTSRDKSIVDYAQWNKLLILLRQGRKNDDYRALLQSIQSDEQHKFHHRLEELSLQEE